MSAAAEQVLSDMEIEQQVAAEAKEEKHRDVPAPEDDEDYSFPAPIAPEDDVFFIGEMLIADEDDDAHADSGDQGEVMCYKLLNIAVKYCISR